MKLSEQIIKSIDKSLESLDDIHLVESTITTLISTPIEEENNNEEEI